MPGEFDPVPSWVRPGRPLFLVEYWLAEAPSRPTTHALSVYEADGVELCFQRSASSERHLGVWFLGIDPGADFDVVRRIRIHLFRIHAERECLKQVLGAVVDRTVELERGREETERLQEYLNRAFSRVFQPSYNGIRQADVLKVAYDSDEIIGEAERATLLAQLEEIRGNIKRKVAERTEPGYFWAPGAGSA